MEVQLKEIIAKLKGEGVEEAQKEAQKIVDAANAKAQEIISAAELQGKRLRRHAEEDAARFTQSGTESVRHAARDLMLLVKKELEGLLTKILLDEVGTVFSGPQLAACITAFIGKWHPDEDVTIEVPPDEVKVLSDTLVKKLQQSAVKGIDIKPFADSSVGFRVSVQQGALTFDFSSKEVTHLLSRLLNSRFAELLS